ncbi:family 1 encapsulin nanocompartment shell protein [Salinibacterium hongtaonis]|uniref:Type 1 encapsulin shell protein n=1 Tax=Homoserinimonas hongtaonis TaxID=2079791 RepID=A0A2U1T099_9MICO|nr:family 1 encapsulin nanocompartment shell protein [Salinibacterium hongtaonis]AWB89830.1 bacteriocin [Salinibacterium hongtaonis]PWB97292.1 bacteriocin [Salinibacterium hongtaonis]
MTLGHLLRRHAPISRPGWRMLDQEARDRLVAALGARKLVDFAGPLGWKHSASVVGRTTPIAEMPVDGLTAKLRRVLPLTEVRADFEMSRDELQNFDRGAVDTDVDALADAALRLASLENAAVFHGWDGAGITGITQATPHSPVPRVADFNDYPKRVAKAVETLLSSGVSGPYGLAVAPETYTSIVETEEEGGYPLFDHVRQILGGPIVWTPGVEGGVVVSLRGGDFLFESGEDLAIGFSGYTTDAVQLYLEETFSFRVATPEAAIALAADGQHSELLTVH